MLKNNYGLSANDFTPIPGNEARLVQFLQAGDIDAASLRAVTIASVPDLKLKKLGSMVDEWKKMTKSDTVPVLGVTIMHKDFAQAHPDAVVKFVRGHDRRDQIRRGRAAEGLRHPAPGRELGREGRDRLRPAMESNL